MVQHKLFRKTREAFTNMCNLLLCAKCSKLPEKKVWIIGDSCTAHKYCELCITSLEGKSCVSCVNQTTAKPTPRIDLFASNLLVQFKQFRKHLKNEENGLTDEDKSKDDIYEFAEENQDEDKTKSKKEIVSKAAETLGKSSTKGVGKRKVSRDEQVEENLQDLPENRSSSKRKVVGGNVDLVKGIDQPSCADIGDVKQIGLSVKNKGVKIVQSSVESVSKELRSAPAQPQLSINITDAVSKKQKKGETPSTIYDLGKPDILMSEKKNINKMALRKEKDNDTFRRPQQERIDPDLDSPPPPLLTQHGNTPKHTNVKTSLDSPVLPILSPAVNNAKINLMKRRGVLNFDDSKRLDRKISPKLAKLEPELIISSDATLAKKLKKRDENVLKSPSVLLVKTEGRRSRSLSRNKVSNSRSSSISSIASTSTTETAKTNITNISSLGSSLLSSEKCNSKGESKLHIACRIGQPEKVKQLVELGADINATDFAGWTPLHEAINSKSPNNFEIISLLCDAGCQVNTPGLENETPLHESVRIGKIRVIKFLLSHGASTKLRNQQGKLPRDVTENETIQKILDGFKGPYIREPSETDVIEAFTKNSVTFFTFEPNDAVLQTYKDDLGCHVAKDFRSEVTHAIFDTREVRNSKVPLSLNYLLAVVNGSWLLDSEWVEKSVQDKKLTDLRKYEIVGFLNKCSQIGVKIDEEVPEKIPQLARNNKEVGNPGLFNGFNIYLYKTCSFGKLTKKDLTKLIVFGDGNPINREPNPDTVDPLDSLMRFHASEQNHKMTLTSHLVLYNKENEPPKKYNMEHVKTLRIDWLIQSIIHFKLMNPDEFL